MREREKVNVSVCIEIGESKMPVYQGRVGTHKVTVLRDTAGNVIVKRKFAQDGQRIGKIQSVKKLIETTARVPVTRVTIHTIFGW